MNRFPTDIPLAEISTLWQFLRGGSATSHRDAADAGWWILGYGLGVTFGTADAEPVILALSTGELHQAILAEIDPVATSPDGTQAAVNINWRKLIQLLIQLLPTLIG